MKFIRVTPVGLFFFVSLSSLCIFFIAFLFTLYFSSVENSLFVLYGFFAELFFFFIDFLTLYLYVLYIKTYPDSIRIVSETHLLIAALLGKFFPDRLTKFALYYLFPFYRAHLAGYVYILFKLFAAIIAWFRVPASHVFVFIISIFFAAPMMYLIYCVDVQLEAGEYLNYFFFFFVGWVALASYNFYKNYM